LPELTDDVDASGVAVETWLASNVPPIDDLLPWTTASHAGIATHRFELAAGSEEALARHVAIGILGRRLVQRPAAFMGWHGALTAGAAIGEHEALVRLHVESLVGTPGEPRNPTDVYGMVAEHVLWRLLLVVDRGLGLPVHLEGHDWDVTDRGGDSVAVYKTDTGFAFRLWESKAVTGETVSPAAAVGRATDQLTRKGWEYLSRWTTVARRLPESDLASFFVEMPDMWKIGDGRAGAGVAISTHSAKPTDTCFVGLVGKFKLPDANKLGNLVLVTNFAAFAVLVQAALWKGAGWNAP
jgi:hypothetical protein